MFRVLELVSVQVLMYGPLSLSALGSGKGDTVAGLQLLMLVSVFVFVNVNCRLASPLHPLSRGGNGGGGGGGGGGGWRSVVRKRLGRKIVERKRVGSVRATEVG
jgi:hypothetical protein